MAEEGDEGSKGPGCGCHPDWFLQMFVAAGNSVVPGGKPFSVMVVVGGRLIAGDIITPSEYLNTFPLPPELRAEIDKAQMEIAYSTPNYLHLKNVKVFTGTSPVAPFVTFTGTPFRIKLSSVDAFTLGSVERVP